MQLDSMIAEFSVRSATIHRMNESMGKASCFIYRKNYHIRLKKANIHSGIFSKGAN